MTLDNIVNIIKEFALQELNVKQVYEGSVYDLNSMKDAKYAFFCITQRNHRYYIDADGSNSMRFNFNLFFIDRLLRDKSNKLQIQSEGIESLKNLVNHLEEHFSCSEVSFTTFTESFADECAGVFCTITIESFENNCYEKPEV